MIRGQKYKVCARKTSVSSYSTDHESSFEGDRLPEASKLKTELCKTFSLMGRCPYGARCRFAHGREELVRVPEQLVQKHRQCHSYWRKGTCSYGTRCQFGHADFGWEARALLEGLREQSEGTTSRLLALLQ
jgi:hypothetical protein